MVIADSTLFINININIRLNVFNPLIVSIIVYWEKETATTNTKKSEKYVMTLLILGSPTHHRVFPKTNH